MGRIPLHRRLISRSYDLKITSPKAPFGDGFIEFKDGVTVPFEQVRQLHNGLAVKFNAQTVTRQLLTAKLFTGMYQNEVAQIKLRGLLAAVGKRLAS